MDYSDFYKILKIICRVGLSAREMRYLLWHFGNRLTYKEIGQDGELSISPQAVQKVIKRAVEKLRQV